jgi:hypothetical protein
LSRTVARGRDFELGGGRGGRRRGGRYRWHQDRVDGDAEGLYGRGCRCIDSGRYSNLCGLEPTRLLASRCPLSVLILNLEQARFEAEGAVEKFM